MARKRREGKKEEGKLKSSLAGREVVLGVTGSIAAYKAAELLRRLKERGALVTVVMTEAAQEFVRPLTFQSLSGRPVLSGLFDEVVKWDVAHVELSELADLVIVAPATASTIARLACGTADDLLAATILGTRAPVILAPAMSTGMLENPLVRENCERLQRLGFELVEPEVGSLASGRVGPGRLAAVETIVERAERVLGRKGDLCGLRFLVTAGPTREAVDPVRFLSSPSSGRMGFAVAARAAKRGGDVLLVSGPSELGVPPGVRLERVTSAAEMREHVVGNVRRCDVLVMAAAVSDYRPARPASEKMRKQDRAIELELVPTPDILKELSGMRGPRVKVGFAVETSEVLRRARKKLENKKLDFIVANTADAFGASRARVWILDSRGGVEELGELAKEAIADRLLDRVAAFAGRRRKSQCAK